MRVYSGAMRVLVLFVATLFLGICGASEPTQPVNTWAADYCRVVKNLNRRIDANSSGPAAAGRRLEALDDAVIELRAVRPAKGTKEAQQALARSIESLSARLKPLAVATPSSDRERDAQAADLALIERDYKAEVQRIRLPDDAATALRGVDGCVFTGG